MNPHPLFCPNQACPSRGLQEAGNLRVHDSRRDRWRCTTCRKTFSARQGTPFFRLQTPEASVIQVLTLLAYGCPLQAIVHAFGYEERTVKDWQDRAGQHAERVHMTLLPQQPMALHHVQADEMRIRLQRRRSVWMAMALCVPTRLWLGGVVSLTRDKSLIRRLACQVKACSCFGPILLVSDGFPAYIDAWRKAFRTPLQTGQRGRPRLIAWPGVVIGQMVKRYQKGRVVDTDQRLIQGTLDQLLALLSEERQISTAYIERLNATFRARLACLVRRTRALARREATVQAGMYLLGCLYNFCTPHQSLSEQRPTTPAMAAGLTNHLWTVAELLWYRVAPPPSVPKKRLGRRPKARTLEPQGDRQLVTV
jgi:transposase-like protein